MNDVTQSKVIHFQSDKKEDLGNFLSDKVIREFYTNDDVSTLFLKLTIN